MARRIPDHRVKDLLESATQVFIRQGYRQTQMADVAEAMGIAKGTLYLYVDSKEALFYTAVRYADGQLPDLSELELPIPKPAAGALAEMLRDRLSKEVAPASLRSAVERRPTTDLAAELEAVVRDLFDIARRHRTAIKLIDRCGRDHPELAELFYEEGRMAQLSLLIRYLEARRPELRAFPDLALVARIILETIATWAIHIHWDPAPQALDLSRAEQTVVQFVLGALLPVGGSHT